MKIEKQSDGGTLTLVLEGRIDTITAPVLEDQLKTSVTDATTSLILDFAQVAYISSAGLRVLLAAHKVMKRQGQLILRHVNDEVMEIFEITGFSDILTIE